MSYLMKYKGKYRLKSEIDESTNNFPKTLEGKNEDIDVYIKCKKGRIFYYGHGVLQAYIPKLGTGRNILKSLGMELNVSIDNFTEIKTKKDGSSYLDKNGNLMKFYNYDKFYKELEQSKIIWDIEETDEEVLFKFKDKDMELIAKYMKPLIGGADNSPFATINLPKKIDYEIPLGNLTEYKKINDLIDKRDKLLLSRISQKFISNIPKKYKQFKGKDIKAIQKKSCLKSKEFIHSLGLWDDYIKYLKKEVDKKLNP